MRWLDYNLTDAGPIQYTRTGVAISIIYQEDLPIVSDLQSSSPMGSELWSLCSNPWIPMTEKMNKTNIFYDGMKLCFAIFIPLSLSIFWFELAPKIFESSYTNEKFSDVCIETECQYVKLALQLFNNALQF